MKSARRRFHSSLGLSVAGLAVSVATSASLAGCGAPLPGDEPGADSAGSVGVVSQALGETILGHPSYQERVALYSANKSRVEPATSAMNDWSEFPAVVPLQWHDNLGTAALAHSEDMRDTPCFQHESCNGTDPFTRIKSYWRGPEASTMGENIAAGVDSGFTAIYNWIEEIGAPPGEKGHRENMFNGAFTHVGFGYAEGGTRFKGYWTQDFAGLSNKVPPLMCGIDFDSKQAQLNRTFGTVYYDAAKKAPDRVLVVVDGKAKQMALVKGTASAGAYEVNLSVEGGCHRYYFSTWVGGVESTYPTGGTLGIDPTDQNGGSCKGYLGGKVGGVDLPAGPVDTGGGDQGGCRAGGGPAGGAGDALALLVPLALLVRRRRATVAA